MRQGTFWTTSIAGKTAFSVPAATAVLDPESRVATQSDLYTAIREGKVPHHYGPGGKYVLQEDLEVLIGRELDEADTKKMNARHHAEVNKRKYPVRAKEETPSAAGSLGHSRGEVLAEVHTDLEDGTNDAPGSVYRPPGTTEAEHPEHPQKPLVTKVMRQLGAVFPDVTDQEHRLALTFYTLALIYQRWYGPLLSEHEHALVAALAQTHEAC